jgi:hypothetical protein
VDSPHHVNRRLIAIMPLLLLLGIIAQAVMLAVVVITYVPCLVWPGILDGPYRLITKGMGRIMVRSIVARKSAPNKTRNGGGTVTISLYNPPGLGASGPGGFPVQWR